MVNFTRITNVSQKQRELSLSIKRAKIITNEKNLLENVKELAQSGIDVKKVC